MNFEVIHGDCLIEMPKLIERGVKVDACITDPPYGTTACAWDSVIPFEPMWANLKRLVKKNSAIVLFSSQPFTSALVMSNPQMFKYEWAWNKVKASGFLDAQRKPLKAHENILIFGSGTSVYNPQMLKGEKHRRGPHNNISLVYGKFEMSAVYESNEYFPKSIISYSKADITKTLHPTQKPVELMRYLVRTYTNEGDTVLDFTMGSGTTGVACAIEGRNFIGIEQSAEYCAIAEARINRAQGIACDIPKPARPYAPAPLFDMAS